MGKSKQSSNDHLPVLLQRSNSLTNRYRAASDSLEGSVVGKKRIRGGKRRRPWPSSRLNDWLTNSTNFHELAGFRRRSLSSKYDFGQLSGRSVKGPQGISRDIG